MYIHGHRGIACQLVSSPSKVAGSIPTAFSTYFVYVVSWVPGGEADKQQAGLRPSGEPSVTSQPLQLSSSLTIAYYKANLLNNFNFIYTMMVTVITNA